MVKEFIHCTLGTGICHTGLKTAFDQDLYDIYQCRFTVNKPLMMSRETARNM